MKTLRLTFAVCAVTIASVSVFANNSLVTKFYRAPSPGTTSPVPSCILANEISITGCEGTASQCTVVINDETYVVSKKIDSNPCVLAKRAL